MSELKLKSGKTFWTNPVFLISLVVLIPAGLGFAMLTGYRNNFYTIESGTTILILLLTMIFLGLIWRNAAVLREREWQRKQSEKKLEELNLRLEKKIMERTRAINANQKKFQSLIEYSNDGFGLLNE